MRGYVFTVRHQARLSYGAAADADQPVEQSAVPLSDNLHHRRLRVMALLQMLR